MNAEHLPKRPAWNCVDCGEPYPCARKREALAREYVGARSSLIFYLGAQFADALQELSRDADPVPAALYSRFFAWVPAALAEAKARGEAQ